MVIGGVDIDKSKSQPSYIILISTVLQRKVVVGKKRHLHKRYNSAVISNLFLISILLHSTFSSDNICYIFVVKIPIK